MIAFKLKGWKVNWDMPQPIAPSVTIASPHTSNWDIIYTIAAFTILKVPFRFTIKKEWMKFPFNLFLGSVGGLGIDRSPKKPGDPRPSMVDAMVELYKDDPKLVIMVTPEGTRSLRTEWKSGFYHVAKNAGVPICLGYLDYGKKEAGIGAKIFPSDDMHSDLQQVMNFYRDKQPKFPEKFSVDKRYDA